MKVCRYSYFSRHYEVRVVDSKVIDLITPEDGALTSIYIQKSGVFRPFLLDKSTITSRRVLLNVRSVRRHVRAA